MFAADISAARPLFEFPVPSDPKGAQLDLNLVTVEAISNHCHVK